MTALDYPIKLGYLAVDADVGYTKEKPHRGIDYGAPEGTPLVIGSTMVGATGKTGRVFGAHLHIQAGRDEWAQNQVVDPAPFVGRGGTVVKVGSASEWGNYVCVKVADVYVYYCHLAWANVKVGDQLKEDKTMDFEDAKKGIQMTKHRDPYDENEVRQYVGMKPNEALGKMLDVEWKGQHEVLKTDYPAIGKQLNAANTAIADLKQKIADLEAAGAGGFTVLPTGKYLFK